MAKALTNRDLVCDKLTRNVRITIEQDEPSATNAIDISFNGVDQERVGAESEIVMRLSRFYTVPLTLTDSSTVDLLQELATKLSAYRVWLRVNPSATREDIPGSVAQWKRDYDEMMEQIVPKGKSTAQVGRDIILEGESLLAGAGTAGTAAIAITRFLPYGGSVS